MGHNSGVLVGLHSRAGEKLCSLACVSLGDVKLSFRKWSPEVNALPVGWPRPGENATNRMRGGLLFSMLIFSMLQNEILNLERPKRGCSTNQSPEVGIRNKKKGGSVY